MKAKNGKDTDNTNLAWNIFFTANTKEQLVEIRTTVD